jgi:hypothetical protein
MFERIAEISDEVHGLSEKIMEMPDQICQMFVELRSNHLEGAGFVTQKTLEECMAEQAKGIAIMLKEFAEGLSSGHVDPSILRSQLLVTAMKTRVSSGARIPTS